MKIFIDGSAGTTGLRIKDRLMKRSDVELTTLSEEQRKDTESRKQALNSAQVAFLCLPDAAAVEAVELVENPDTVIIDTSTAHRTSEGWAYGFPELSAEFEDKIKNSKRIAVPGCHAGGFIALVYPLVEAGVLGNDALLSCYSLTGYSGGGKKKIADYQARTDGEAMDAPAQYATASAHKHLPEMAHICGLAQQPLFNPIIGDFYAGMLVCVPLYAKLLRKPVTPASLYEYYASYYAGQKLLSVREPIGNETLYANAYAGRDDMEILISGNDERINLFARFCNLGKGASGAAVQCLNLMTGADETEGLFCGPTPTKGNDQK